MNEEEKYQQYISNGGKVSFEDWQYLSTMIDTEQLDELAGLKKKVNPQENQLSNQAPQVTAVPISNELELNPAQKQQLQIAQSQNEASTLPLESLQSLETQNSSLGLDSPEGNSFSAFPQSNTLPQNNIKPTIPESSVNSQYIPAIRNPLSTKADPKRLLGVDNQKTEKDDDDIFRLLPNEELDTIDYKKPKDVKLDIVTSGEFGGEDSVGNLISKEQELAEYQSWQSNGWGTILPDEKNGRPQFKVNESGQNPIKELLGMKSPDAYDQRSATNKAMAPILQGAEAENRIKEQQESVLGKDYIQQNGVLTRDEFQQAKYQNLVQDYINQGNTEEQASMLATQSINDEAQQKADTTKQYIDGILQRGQYVNDLFEGEAKGDAALTATEKLGWNKVLSNYSHDFADYLQERGYNKFGEVGDYNFELEAGKANGRRRILDDFFNWKKQNISDYSVVLKNRDESNKILINDAVKNKDSVELQRLREQRNNTSLAKINEEVNLFKKLNQDEISINKDFDITEKKKIDAAKEYAGYENGNFGDLLSYSTKTIGTGIFKVAADVVAAPFALVSPVSKTTRQLNETLNAEAQNPFNVLQSGWTDKVKIYKDEKTGKEYEERFGFVYEKDKDGNLKLDEKLTYNGTSGLKFLKNETDTNISSVAGTIVNMTGTMVAADGIAGLAKSATSSRLLSWAGKSALELGKENLLTKALYSGAEAAQSYNKASALAWSYVTARQNMETAQDAGLSPLQSLAYTVFQSAATGLMTRVHPDSVFFKEYSATNKNLFSLLSQNKIEEGKLLVSDFVKKYAKSAFGENVQEFSEQVVQDFVNQGFNYINEKDKDGNDKFANSSVEDYFAIGEQTSAYTFVLNAFNALGRGRIRMTGLNNLEKAIVASQIPDAKKMLYDLSEKSLTGYSFDKANKMLDEIKTVEKYTNQIPDGINLTVSESAEVIEKLQQSERLKEQLRSNESTPANSIINEQINTINKSVEDIYKVGLERANKTRYALNAKKGESINSISEIPWLKRQFLTSGSENRFQYSIDGKTYVAETKEDAIKTINHHFNEENPQPESQQETVQTETGINESQPEQTTASDIESGLNESISYLLEDEPTIQRLKDAGTPDEVIKALPKNFRIREKWLMDGENLLEKIKNTATKSGALEVGYRRDENGEISDYDAGKVTINKVVAMLSSQEGRNHVLTHEAVHAATVLAMEDIKDNKNAYSKEQQEAYDNLEWYPGYFKEMVDSGEKLPYRGTQGMYGLTNPYEFIAEFVSNKGFREWIIDRGNEPFRDRVKPDRTILQKIWDNILRLVGINKERPTNFDEKFLKQVNDEIEVLLKAQTEIYEKVSQSKEKNQESTRTKSEQSNNPTKDTVVEETDTSDQNQKDAISEEEQTARNIEALQKLLEQQNSQSTPEVKIEDKEVISQFGTKGLEMFSRFENSYSESNRNRVISNANKIAQIDGNNKVSLENLAEAIQIEQLYSDNFEQWNKDLKKGDQEKSTIERVSNITGIKFNTNNETSDTTTSEDTQPQSSEERKTVTTPDGKNFYQKEDGNWYETNTKGAESKVTRKTRISELEAIARENTLEYSSEKNDYTYKRYQDGTEEIISPKGNVISPTATKNGKTVKNSVFTKNKAKIFGEKTDNEIKVEEAKRLKETLGNFYPSNARDAALLYFANNGKVSSESISQEVLGNSETLESRGITPRKLTDHTWAYLGKGTQDSIQKVAEKLAVEYPHLDEQDIRNELIDTVNSYSSALEIQDEIVDLYNRSNDPYFGFTNKEINEQWDAQLNEEQKIFRDSIEDVFNQFSEEELFDYYKQQFDNSIHSLTNEQQDQLYTSTEPNSRTNRTQQSNQNQSNDGGNQRSQSKRQSAEEVKPDSNAQFQIIDNFTSEEKSIIDTAKSNGTYMKAPNGKSTNLTEKQWAQTRTKNFKDWFGDWENDAENSSKVIDGNGEPLVVYHGTWADFNEFEPTQTNFYQETEGWYFFTDKRESANMFGRKVMPVFLNIDNPTIETQGTFKTWNLYDDEGNYGFIAPNTDTGNGGIANQYVVENPNQIKSATNNNGEFSNDSNDIRFQTENNSSSNQRFSPISKQTFDSLIERLKKPFTKAFKNLNVTTDFNSFLDKAKALGLNVNFDSKFQINNDLRKQKQLELINRTNPAPNDYNTWVRSEDDILTAQEAFDEAFSDGEMFPDFTVEDMQEALDSGEITVYSSYPINEGVFVTPSRMNAESYSGNGKVYSKTVKTDDLAWIDQGEGQYAPVQLMKTSNGEIYGAKLPDGTIYINPKKLNANTPIHEFSHLWEQIMPTAWKKGVSIFKETTTGKKLVEQLNKDGNYSQLSEEELWSEAMNTHIGNLGEEQYQRQPKGKMAEFIDWFKNTMSRFWNTVTGRNELNKEMALTDFTNKVLGDLLGEKEITPESERNSIKAIQFMTAFKAIDLKKQIKNLWNLATTQNSGTEKIILGEISDDAKKLLSELSGLDFEKVGNINLNQSNLRHIFKDHYDGNEKDKGNNIPLKKYEIENLPEILNSPTHIIYGKEKGVNVFFFVKEDGNNSYVTVQVYSGKNRNLNVRTMYKSKKDSNQRADELFSSLSTPKTRSGAPLSNTKILNISNTNQIDFQIVGEKGAGNLDKMEEATTRLDNLSVAREMETSGKSEKEIRLATGWEKGVDGKWRYEIEDVKIKYPFPSGGQLWKNVFDGANRNQRVGPIRLSELVTGEILNIYPKLNDIIISIQDGYGGSFITNVYKNSTRNIISIGANNTMSDVKSTLSHEIQHAIQEIEGFANGGNIQTASKLDSETIKEISQVEKILKDLIKFKSENEWSTEDKTIADLVNGEIKNYPNDYPQSIYNWAKRIAEQGHSEIDMFLKETPFQQYQRLAGETEARNVQTRANMSMEERRATLLSETEDVARVDQIILMNSLGFQESNSGNDNKIPTRTVTNIINEIQKNGNQAGYEKLINSSWYKNLSENEQNAFNENNFIQTLLSNSVDKNKKVESQNEKLKDKIETLKENYKKKIDEIKTTSKRDSRERIAKVRNIQKQAYNDLVNLVTSEKIKRQLTPTETSRLIKAADAILNTNNTAKALDSFIGLYNKINTSENEKQQANDSKRLENISNTVTDSFSDGKTLEEIFKDNPSLFKFDSSKEVARRIFERLESQSKPDAKALDKSLENSRLVNEALKNKRSFKQIVTDTKRRWIKEVSDRQFLPKNLAKKLGMKGTYHRMIANGGASASANQAYQKVYDKVFAMMTNEDKTNFNEIIKLRRIISIDKNRESKGLAPIDHEGGTNRFEAQAALDQMKTKIGEEKFNKLSNSATTYFNAFRELLGEMKSNGLINQGQYDSMIDLDYRPTVFMNHLFDLEFEDGGNGNLTLKNARPIVGNNFGESVSGMSKDQIRSIQEGSTQLILNDSELLLGNAILGRKKAMFMNEVNKTFITKDFPTAKVKYEELKAKPTNELKSEDKRFIKYFEELNTMIKENPMVDITPSGNPKFAKSDLPTGWKIAYYFENGIRKEFFMREDFYEQWHDTMNKLIDGTAKEIISTVSGSAVTKMMATGRNPGFALVNTPRDFGSVLMFSPEYSKVTPYAVLQLTKDAVKGIGEIFKYNNTEKDSVLTKYLDYGGGMDFLNTEGENPLVFKWYEKIFGKTTNNKTKTIFTKAFDVATFKSVSNYSEMMFRVAVFDRAVQNRLRDIGAKNITELDQETQDNIYYSAVASARAVLDFNQGGRSVKALESVIPYINAATQGTRVLADRMTENPYDTTSRLLQGSTMLASMALGFSLLAMKAFGDDDDDKRSSLEKYLDVKDRLTTFQKRGYFHFFTGNKNKDGEYNTLKIAVPQALTPFYAMIDAGMDDLIRMKLGRETKGFGYAMEQFKEAFSANVDPFGLSEPTKIATKNPFVKAAVTYTSGYDYFRNQQLDKSIDKVPRPAEGRQNSKVEDFYKKWGIETGLSPVRMKYAVESVLTSPETNMFLEMIYGGVDEITGYDSGFNDKKGFVQTALGSLQKRITAETSEYGAMMNSISDDDRKAIEEKAFKDELINEEADKIMRRYKSPEMLGEEINGLMNKKNIPVDKKIELVTTIVERVKNVETSGGNDPRIWDIKYNTYNSAEAKAEAIVRYFGKDFQNKPEVMQKLLLNQVLTDKVWMSLSRVHKIKQKE